MKVLVTRTAPGADRTLDRLKALGMDAVRAVTAEICPNEVQWPAHVEAVAVTSPNGAARVIDLCPSRSLPVYAVGDATAATLRQAGFANVTSASGDGAALARLILNQGKPDHVVHIRGADQAFDLVAALQNGGIQAESLIAYAAQTVRALPKDALEAVQPGNIVLVHSAKGAQRFVALAGGGKALHGLRAVAMSAEAAKPLEGAGLARIDIASTPTESALIEALIANPV